MHVRPWFELLPPILQEVTCPPPPPIGRRRAAQPAATADASAPGTWFPVDVFVHDEQP
jgi:hypothetical protein